MAAAAYQIATALPYPVGMAAGYEDDDAFEGPTPRDETANDPVVRARELLEQIRIHGELAAVFEGPRKFDNAVLGLDADLARDVQQAVGRLEKSKQPNTGPILPPDMTEAAAKVLELPTTRPMLTTGDYHILRRPGEAMLVRWLAGDEVDTFYDRYTAHVTAALEQRREDERQELGWREDDLGQAYLEALDELEPDAATWYLRDTIQKHGLFLLSTLAVDEIDILHLCDTLMGLHAADVVGDASAPDRDDEDAPDSERTWYFKLFSLRGKTKDVERMCFFAYLQRASDDLW
jgi:hypothetical protein